LLAFPGKTDMIIYFPCTKHSKQFSHSSTYSKFKLLSIFLSFSASLRKQDEKKRENMCFFTIILFHYHTTSFNSSCATAKCLCVIFAVLFWKIACWLPTASYIDCKKKWKNENCRFQREKNSFAVPQWLDSNVCIHYHCCE
jgi:hypothetical protein